MSLLGPEVQKLPTTHPIRCFDPSHLWLMQCNGGPGMRKERKGLNLFYSEKETFVNMLFQSILMEVFRVQIFIGWSIHVNGDGMPRLPTIKDVESILNFVLSVMNGNE
jgi:hypothetical protein